jgi:dinuclear metal center YbgI/SA1388 family protein
MAEAPAVVTVANVAAYLEKFAPGDLAAGWDNVGLLLGNPENEVRRLMTCLTVTPESAAEAIDAGAQLIVTHHPILFQPVQRLTTSSPEGRTVLALARANVAVYSPHTAFDNTEDGINHMLVRRLQLQEVLSLRPKPGPGSCKVVVFMPDLDLSRVAEAMFAAGAGNIGRYSQCSFRLAGTGTFFGGEGTNPTIGQQGRREEVQEWRLEAVCPEAMVPEVVAAIRRSHSYEEPAYDVYPLKPSASTRGEGRIGRLPAACSLRELAQTTKAVLGSSLVQFVGDPQRTVERIALACGAGGEFLADAFRAGADVLLTGEMRFHDFLAAQAREIALVLPGHYATERFGVEELAVRLSEQWPSLEVWASRHEQDPLCSV